MKKMESPYIDSSNTWIKQLVGMGCHQFNADTAMKGEEMPFMDVRSGCVIVADARLDYKVELAQELALDSNEIRNSYSSHLILMSYLKWGERCINHFLGDFAFVIWDQNKKRLFCARDHFGCRPLFYMDHQDYLVLCSDPIAFNALPNFNIQIEEQFILDSICSILPLKGRSAFKDINRLPPAHLLLFNQGERIQITRYWDLQIQNEFVSISEKQAKETLKRLFIDAVRQRRCSSFPVGIELSGGLDSSSIASVIQDHANRDIPVYAFSHSISEHQSIRPYHYKSELIYSSKIVEVCDIDQHYIITVEDPPGGYTAITKHLNLMHMPDNQGYAMMSDLLYKTVHDSGAKILISGFGGDEGVTYQGKGLFRELASKREFKKLWGELKSRTRKKGGNLYFQIFKHYIYFFFPWIINLFRKDWRRSRFANFAVNKELGIKYRMKEKFLNYVNISADSDVRMIQNRKLMHAHISDRLESSYFAAKAFGIEYRYPFLDVRLIEFFYSLPSELKYKNGISRYLFRSAMEGILPDEIRLREDKSNMTIPNVLYRIVIDEEKFKDVIKEGKNNNQFHYVDYNKLDWMIDQFKSYENRKELNFSPRAFLSPITVIILQKWQREGKIDIGIKC